MKTIVAATSPPPPAGPKGPGPWWRNNWVITAAIVAAIAGVGAVAPSSTPAPKKAAVVAAPAPDVMPPELQKILDEPDLTLCDLAASNRTMYLAVIHNITDVAPRATWVDDASSTFSQWADATRQDLIDAKGSRAQRGAVSNLAAALDHLGAQRAGGATVFSAEIRRLESADAKILKVCG